MLRIRNASAMLLRLGGGGDGMAALIRGLSVAQVVFSQHGVVEEERTTSFTRKYCISAMCGYVPVSVRFMSGSVYLK